jgi:hypothetical protein
MNQGAPSVESRHICTVPTATISSAPTEPEVGYNSQGWNESNMRKRPEAVAPEPKPEGGCGCPHGCNRQCDLEGRCPFCYNAGRGCPVLFHGRAEPSQSGERAFMSAEEFVALNPHDDPPPKWWYKKMEAYLQAA